jgi:WD repeat-containing protein 23
MSSSHPPTSPPSEDTNATAVVYDPSDPFWRDTDDDDDMDFEIAEEGSEETADEGESLSFHGMLNEVVMHGK